MIPTPTIPLISAARLGAAAAVLGLAVACAGPAVAAPKAPQVSDDGSRIAAPFASFSGLDKITGRIISFDVAIDETVQFGALQVTPRVCYARPQTLAPLTDSFVEVDEITLDNKIRRIFTGWMFADSPGLHAVEHAVYDVWLTDCKMASSDAAANAKAGVDPAAVKPVEAPAVKPAAPSAQPPAAPKPTPAAAAPAPSPAAAAQPAAPKPPAPPKPAQAPAAATTNATGPAPLPTRSELPPLQTVPPLR